jgi:FkbM family methyltransferase
MVAKHKVTRLLKRLKSDAATPSQYGRMAVRDRFDDIRTKVTTNASVIVDGGASVGNMTSMFLEQYPTATIHAIEPIPESIEYLQSRFGTNPRVSIHPCAIGADNREIEFHVLKHQGASSILKSSVHSHHYHPDKSKVRQTIQVAMKRLDVLLDVEIDVLKLDLQGYELEALKGCGNLLNRIKAITAEIEFISLYEGQPLFGDVDAFLRESGFRLLNLYELWTHPDGQLTAGDAVYLNNRYF